MSAANPLPASGAPADKRPYEPSMEEILASIRRIIADDQTLPGKAILGEPEADPDAPVSLHPPVPTSSPAPSLFSSTHHDFVPPQAAAEPHIEPAARLPEPQIQPQDQQQPHMPPDPVLQTPVSDAVRAYGVIAAPQFAAPHGPAGDPELETAEPAPQMRTTTPPEPEAPAAPVAPLSPAAAFKEDDETLYDQAIEPSPLPLHIQDEVPAARPTAEAAGLFSSATDTSITSAFNMLAASRLADNSDELMNLAREMIRPLLRSWIDDNLPSMVERLVRAEIERVARGGR